MMAASVKVEKTEMERSGQVQNKFQKYRTNSFIDVGYEMKSDIRADDKSFDLDVTVCLKGNSMGVTDLVEKNQEF